ncbi:MAG: metallophosphoesterase [Spirochaetia bacterium]|jgi:DNA repair exonuclease SbcCD nuclease subunit|nr:metallophosphoesterase [Spirochaetia bacterium]
MNCLLCADVHLKEAEKAYCLFVLNELVFLCEREKCGALFFAGDVFDSRPDAEALRGDFRACLDRLSPDVRVFFLPGNHEELRASGMPALESLDFGRARLLSEKPFSFEVLDGSSELLALPFQKDYSDYRSWEVPPKTGALRILLAHGTVPGITYTGPEEDDDGGVLDADIFAYFGADLAALGHLHGHSVTAFGKTCVAYPGSARVWREGEAGPRQVLVFSTDKMPPRPRPLALAAAGEYRVVPVYAAPGGDLRGPDEKEMAGWKAADWLRLEVSGVVEDEVPVMDALREMQAGLKKKFRRVTQSAENLSVLQGISSHPLARRFLEKWEKDAGRYSASGDAYFLARLKGLAAIKEILEGKK